MRNKYEIFEPFFSGIPYVEVHGDAFCYSDLYEIVGRHKFMTTFFLKGDSSSYLNYGREVLGTINYTAKELAGLSRTKGQEISDTVRIFSVQNEMSLPKKKLLKYQGISINDIDYISYLAVAHETEILPTGEKKVPNIIEIEVDCEGIDPYALYTGYIAAKMRDDVKLIDFEREKYIGIVLANNNGRIDSRILEKFGFTKSTVANNRGVFKYLYEVKESRGTLSDTEKENLSDIKLNHLLKTILKIYEELERNGVTSARSVEHQSKIAAILDPAVRFDSEILLHGNHQVYWDIDSYLHISMRHIKNFQIGAAEDKTPLPYQLKDLKPVIEKVLSILKDEYQQHRLEQPNDFFSRHGKMAVLFNGDHYHVKIAPDGRLVQFHSVGVDV